MNEISLYTASLQGSCRSGSDNTGFYVHALKIPRNDAVALCGEAPGKKSNGWTGDSSRVVTCPKCLDKISTINKKIEFVCDSNLDVGF